MAPGAVHLRCMPQHGLANSHTLSFKGLWSSVNCLLIQHGRAQQLVVEVPPYTRNIHTVTEGETQVDNETTLVQLLTQQEVGRWEESGPCICFGTRALVFLLLMKSHPIWDRPLLQNPQWICLTGGKSVSVFAGGMSAEPLSSWDRWEK